MREVDMYLSGTKGPRVGIGKCERTGCDGKARSRIPAGTSWNSARPLSRRIPCGPRVLRSAPHPLSHPLSSPEYSVQSCTGSDLRRRHDLLCLSLSAPPSSPTERASVVTTPQPSSITRAKHPRSGTGPSSLCIFSSRVSSRSSSPLFSP